MTLDELRAAGRRQDIEVWPQTRPLWPGDTNQWRYRKGSREVGSLACDTEAECWHALLAR